MGNSKKSKKSHRSHKSRRRSNSSSSDSSRNAHEETRVKKKSKQEKVEEPEDLTPLKELISSPSDLAKAAVTTIHWDLVSSMLPRCMQGRCREDVIDLVTTELEGMSKKRIISVLEGHELSSSSSSEDSESDSSSDKEDGELTEPAQSVRNSAPDDALKGSPIEKRRSSSSPSQQKKARLRESSDVSDTFSDVELTEG